MQSGVITEKSAVQRRVQHLPLVDPGVGRVVGKSHIAAWLWRSTVALVRNGSLNGGKAEQGRADNKKQRRKKKRKKKRMKEETKMSQGREKVVFTPFAACEPVEPAFLAACIPVLACIWRPRCWTCRLCAVDLFPVAPYKLESKSRID